MLSDHLGVLITPDLCWPCPISSRVASGEPQLLQPKFEGCSLAGDGACSQSAEQHATPLLLLRGE